MDYQKNYSTIDRTMHDEQGRRKKAKKIIAILLDYCKKHSLNPKTLLVLEIGCSAGGMTIEFVKEFRKITAIDIDRSALSVARKKHAKRNITYRYADALHLPFNNASFNVVILNHVYEHVPDATMLMHQVHRVLQKNGICYFSGPQKYTIIEPHHHIPFLSWVPKKICPLLL